MQMSRQVHFSGYMNNNNNKSQNIYMYAYITNFVLTINYIHRRRNSNIRCTDCRQKTDFSFIIILFKLIDALCP